MSRAVRDGEALVGGIPRANLLPPSIVVAERAAAKRKGALGAIAAAAVLAGVAVAAAAWYAGTRQSALEAEQQTTDSLLAQQLEFSEVRVIEDAIATAEAARVLATAPEVDWREYLDYIQSSLPAGTVVTSFNLQSGTVTTPFAPPSDPLQGPRVAQLSFVAQSPGLLDVSQWIDNLATIPGFQDATPSSIQVEDGVTTSTIVMNVNAEALAQRFVETEDEQ